MRRRLLFLACVGILGAYSALLNVLDFGAVAGSDELEQSVVNREAIRHVRLIGNVGVKR